MSNVRTRIVRLTAASALVISVGAAVAAGPTAASEQSPAISSPITMAAGAPIDAGSAPTSSESADAATTGCVSHCWVYTGRRFSVEDACYQAGGALLSTNRSYDDYMCWPVVTGWNYTSYWELWAHKR